MYVAKKSSVNFQVGLDAGVWGFKNHRVEYDLIEPGDELLMATGWQGGSPRVQPSEWIGSMIGRVVRGRVTSRIFTDRTPLWPDERDSDVSYPVRFTFEVSGEELEVDLHPGVTFAEDIVEAFRWSAINKGQARVIEGANTGDPPLASTTQRPLVLVENERTAGGRYDHWQDATGERYQFPNQYRNRFTPGRRFVYYRGARRADGSRATPEYFGHGTIGDVFLDPDTDQSHPKARWKWYCEIADYEPFRKPVPFKDGDEYIEQIEQNQWGVAVRELPAGAYDLILEGADARPIVAKAEDLNLPAMQPEAAGSGSLLRIVRKSERSGTGSGGGRRSRHAKATGDRGEEAVWQFLHATLPSDEAATLRWLAREGKTPGYDISYRSGGEKIGVEVKASTGGGFPAIELTQNEWAAAEKLGPRYRIALVAFATSASPRVGFLDNPAAGVSAEVLSLAPIVWRLTRLSGQQDDN